ncbi:MAG TPA: oligosaccharide flippase family protein [Mycobacteriales bacterium]|nr:oligosaccharide flippase family protein [Mycobacteriales bacterium]HWA68166.1 oligosaccharide flippase family protein [Mycobacteriales bacterium]
MSLQSDAEPIAGGTEPPPDGVLETGRLGRYLRSSAGVVVIGEASYRVGTFAILLVLARAMRPADYGSVVIFFTVLTLGAVVSQFGLPPTAVRLISARLTSDGASGAKRAAWSTWLVAAVIAALLLPVLALVVLPPTLRDFTHDPQLARLSTLVAVGVVFEGFQITVAEIFRGFHRVGLAVTFGFAGRAVLILGAIGGLAAADAVTVRRVVLVYAVAVCALSVCASLAMLASLGRATHPTRRTADLSVEISAVVRFALPILVYTVANRLLVQGDTLIVGHLASRVDTATYNLASRICNLLFVPYVAGTLVLAPVVAGLWSRNDRDRIERVARAAASVSGGLTCVGCIVAACVGGPAIRVVFGHAYAGGGVLLALLAIGPAAAALTAGAAVVLTSTGHQRATMIGSVAVTIATLGAEFGLGEHYGARGVAVASGLGSVAQGVAMAVLAWRLVAIRTWPSLAVADLRHALGKRS